MIYLSYVAMLIAGFMMGWKLRDLFAWKKEKRLEFLIGDLRNDVQIRDALLLAELPPWRHDLVEQLQRHEMERGGSLPR